MKHLKKFSEFNTINENLAGVAAAYTFNNRRSGGRSGGVGKGYYSSQNWHRDLEILNKKHLSIDVNDIDIPWYKFGKSKEDFLEEEKQIRSKILEEIKRLKEENFEFEINTIVYDLLKNKTKDQKEVDNLRNRVNGKDISKEKKRDLINQIIKIYMNELTEPFDSTLIEEEVTERLFKFFSENGNIEDYKPVEPTPVDPKVLKKINEYEKDLEKIRNKYK